ncbi:malic enzyme, malate dehydrogenase/oxaloacetate-decarboxylating [Neisseria gonorrhoeae]|uniref:Malic enzyme, malate dehydrogenase/oxaloacetate-decarboxylating n=1 Tax=Neisseria gonorrhoeae TaxID=485 RepID=A0A378VZ74_NEIGO|nr:malic enzyme, malate dehydrogenase/oxaloacetate-decarboxylating [Neisseria gonorrhoeae]
MMTRKRFGQFDSNLFLATGLTHGKLIERSRPQVPRITRSGQISVTPTKSLATDKDLALAYSPGVAAPVWKSMPIRKCLQIHRQRQLGRRHFQRYGRFGLGRHRRAGGQTRDGRQRRIVQKFAGVDVFDIEIDEKDPQKLVDIIAALEPTFGGINLEDIKAPECFYIERELRKRCKIPVFHDDQHGTAIITAAAVLNALRYTGRKIEEATLVCSGAGAAAIACLNQLLDLGLKRENVTVCDSKGVIYQTREDKDRMDESKNSTPLKTTAGAYLPMRLKAKTSSWASPAQTC